MKNIILCIVTCTVDEIAPMQGVNEMNIQNIGKAQNSSLGGGDIFDYL